MKEKEVEKYIKELGFTPRHNCKALAAAVTHYCYEIEREMFGARVPTELELLELLLANKPIADLHTHSYGFHTRNGRQIINALEDKYYEEIDMEII